MESEAKEISHKIDEMVEEHNRLLEIIKRLREIAQQLELGNLLPKEKLSEKHLHNLKKRKRPLYYFW